MANHPFPYDMNYIVADLPPSVKAKVNQVMQAAMDFAFIGTADPMDFADIEQALHVARYNLEQTIKTVIKNAEKQNNEDWRAMKNIAYNAGYYQAECGLPSDSKLGPLTLADCSKFMHAQRKRSQANG